VSKPNWRDALERYPVPLFAFLMLLVATQVTFANLPNNKFFAGHDSGFYTLFPDQLIRTSAGTWEVKTALGFPNFQALVTLPYALLDLAIHAFHPSGAVVGRIFFELQILLCEFGTFWIAWLILERFYAEASSLLRAVASLAAAFVGTFNIFTAILLMYPPSNFQAGVFIWPVVIAFELYLLWKRPTLSVAILFGILLTLAMPGNPAHTILGFALVVAIYVANSLATGAWKWRLAATVCSVTFFTSVFFWLPAFASLFLYHGNVSAPEGANAAALSGSEDLIKLRTTIAALLRFDGLLWWPKTRNAALYDSPLMLLATYAPAAVAVVALFSKRWIARAIWVLLLVGIELAKNAHPPFQLNLLWLMTHVPVFAAFRQAYDKFVLYIMLALPALTAIGLVIILRQRRLVAVGIGALVLIFVSSWPFLAGRIVEPYFLTTIPPDYRTVDRLMGADPQTRVLSLPGAPFEINVTNWFKGGNFENLLYRAHAVNGAIFKHRSISAAPLYDDFDLLQAQELPDLMGLLGVYDIQYVLLHKDYLTSYRMAFDFERYQVLGPLLAQASERYLDADNRLQKIYEGSSLVLYRARDRATLPHAYATYDAAMNLGYENTLYGVVDAGLMDSGSHPEILFVGNQVRPAGARSYDALDRLAQRTRFLIVSPLIPQTPALYREQVSLGAYDAQTLAQRYSQLAKPTYYIFVQPHGDWLKGSIVRQENLAGLFSLNRAQVSSVGMVISANHVARLAYHDVVGLEGNAPWPLSAFAAEPVVDDIISDADLVDPTEAPVAGATPPPLDPAAAGVPSVRAPASIAVDRTSGTYQVKLQRGGEQEELVVASRAIRPLSLLSDPRVTFDYQFSDPKNQAAWLRFDLRDNHGHRIFLDKYLDGSGHLEGFDVRDNLQMGLDRRFSKLVALHRTDPQWVARQPLFNPEQADGFVLSGLRLIMGKLPFTDFSQTPDEVSFRFRGLQLVLGGPSPPTYLKEGYRLNFSALPMHPQLQGVPEISSAVKDGARLFNATTSGQANASASFVVRLPPINIVQYRWLHLRYWQPSSNEELVLKLGFQSGTAVREVVAGLDLAANTPTDAPPPEAWISKSNFPSPDHPLALDNAAVSRPLDEGWRELVCDLSRIAAYRAGTLRPHLDYLKLEFRVIPPPPDTPAGIPRSLVFGFGDLMFSGQTDALTPPAGTLLEIDGKPQPVVGSTPVGGAKDELALRFPTLNLHAGNHRIMTRVGRAWSVRSVTIGPRDLRAAVSPSVTIRHIDDELFAVHVDRRQPMWLSFAETYHSGWRLIQAAAPRNRLQWAASLRWLSKPAGDHVMGNAYNNTWFVGGSAPADYVIDFAPQDFAVAGKVLALVATLVALGFSAYWWRR